MEYRRYESQLVEAYDRSAMQYRDDDEIEARSENHQRLGGNLRRICRAFSRPVRVLEMGCGTGRYFHWLENVELLVGTDLSAEMLRQAERPVLADRVSVQQIRLLRGNIYELNFDPGSFDFIYSLGMFGYGAALTPELCGKIYSWLSPGGRLYFDAIEKRHFGRAYELKKSVKSALLPMLPDSVRQRLEARESSSVPVVNHTRQQVERMMEASGFCDFAISSNTCQSPLWSGMHLECCARKPGSSGGTVDHLELDLEPAGARQG